MKFTVVHPDLDRAPLYDTESEAVEAAADLAGALVLPVATD